MYLSEAAVDDGDSHRVRVSSVETFVVDAGWRAWVCIRVRTDKGLTGLGEATVEGQERAVVGALDALRPQVIGRAIADIADIAALRTSLLADSFWGGVVYLSAVGAIEMACWDLLGKARDLPVHALLGGAIRSEVTCYTHVSEAPAGGPEGRRAEEAADAVAEGWTGLKWDPLPVGGEELTIDMLGAIEADVAAVREAVGPATALMLDLHGRLDLPKAVALGRALAPYDLVFIEEPLPPWNLKGLQELRTLVDVPLAAGERVFTAAEWTTVLGVGAIEHAQPDVIHVAGLLGIVAVGGLAADAGVRVVPHNPNGPIATAASVHAAAVIPTLTRLEIAGDDYRWFAPWRDELVRDASILSVKDSVIRVPMIPGLGIELDDEAMARHLVSH